jgi:hypothetical protein
MYSTGEENDASVSSLRRSNHRGGRSRTRRTNNGSHHQQQQPQLQQQSQLPPPPPLPSQQPKVHRFTKDQQHYQPHHHQPAPSEREEEVKYDQENALPTMSRLNIVSSDTNAVKARSESSQVQQHKPRPPSTKPPAKKVTTPAPPVPPPMEISQTNVKPSVSNNITPSAPVATTTSTTSKSSTTVVPLTVAPEVDFSLLNHAAMMTMMKKKDNEDCSPKGVNENNGGEEEDREKDDEFDSRPRLYERVSKHSLNVVGVAQEIELKRSSVTNHEVSYEVSDQVSYVDEEEEIERQRSKQVKNKYICITQKSCSMHNRLIVYEICFSCSLIVVSPHRSLHQFLFFQLIHCFKMLYVQGSFFSTSPHSFLKASKRQRICP